MRTLRSLTALAAVLALPATALSAVHEVDVLNFAFSPKDIVVQQGDTVRWNWVVGDHTIANGANPFESGAGTIFDNPSNSGNIVFEWPVDQPVGLLTYHCGPHWFAGMTGTIDIQPGGPSNVSYIVDVSDSGFSETLLSIASGDTVRWTWSSGTHTTTSGASSSPIHNPGSLWDEVIDGANPQFSYVFDNPGTFHFFCRAHEFTGPPAGVVGITETAAAASGAFGTVVVDGATTGLPDDGGRLGSRLLAPYPNPSSRTHNLQLVLGQEARVRMEIFDLQGRKVYSTPEKLMPEGDNMLRWMGEIRGGRTAAPGMYLVRVVAGEQVFLAKVFRAASSHAHHH